MTKVEKYLIDKGFDISSLLKDTTVYKTSNMDKAAAMIKAAVDERRHIHVVGDYDCDGVMSGMELYYILKELGADFSIRFPKKMSEGYGISEKIISEIPDGSLVITIDNGIAAVEPIAIAKSRGMSVIVLDHHLIRGDGLLPEADVTVDPHIYKRDDEFEDYCGGGLAYILSKALLLSRETVYKCNALAAIATVQDVVSLTGDNRNIVRNGLKLINKELVDIPGLHALIGEMGLVPCDDLVKGINEEHISFQIGPCVNAMGRMYDDGAQMFFERIVHYDIHGIEGVREIVATNKLRKEKTAEQNNVLFLIAETKASPDRTCMVLYSGDLHEGIVGINAAKIAEKYNMPAIVFSDAEDPEYLKGSARSIPGVHIKECLDKIADLTVAYGGHAGAAGITIRKADLEAFDEAINAVIPKCSEDDGRVSSDFEILESEAFEVFNDLRKYAPWGEGFPAPVIRIKNFQLAKNYGKFYRFIGESGVSMNGNKIDAVSFELKEKFQKANCPLTINAVGTLGWSSYTKRPQILLLDFDPIIRQKQPTVLV